ncbi:MAG: extracellular solute-binding protein [Acidimicrobiia bacterium]|nr:extracellular solute-binding protein [Acidimicrobiia bacterium]
MQRWMKLAALLSALALFAAACGGSDTAETVAPTPDETTATTQATTDTTMAEEMMGLTGTVTLWHGWTEAEIGSLNDVIAGFKAIYPDVTVNVLFTPFDDLQNKVETSWGTGEGPTVVIGATDWAPAFLAADFIWDLKGLVSDDVVAGLNSAAVDAVTYDGMYAGLPQTLKGVVMYRNAALVSEAPQTLEDVIAAGNGSLERGFFFSMAHLLTACDGSIADADGNPTFDDAAGVCWAELVNSFPGNSSDYYSDNDLDTFKAGETGIIIDGTWNASALAEAIGAENLVIDPWPSAADGALGGVVQTESIYIGNIAEGEELDAAVAFVEYFLGVEAQTMLANPAKAGHVPAATGVEVTDPMMAGQVAAFASSPAQPRFGGCYWGNLDSALQTYFGGTLTAQEALTQASEAIKSAIAAGECS